MEFLVTGPIVNIISDEEAKICSQLPIGIYNKVARKMSYL